MPFKFKTIVSNSSHIASQIVDLSISHDAVRTFISLAYQRGMTLLSISKITGKSIPTIIKNYIVESQLIAENEMKEIWT